MPRGAVMPFVPRVPSAQDSRPRDPSEKPGAGALSNIFAFLAVNKWPQLSRSAQNSYRQLVKLCAAFPSQYPAVGEVLAWVTSLRRLYPPPEGCTDSWTVHAHWKNLAAAYNDAKEWGLVEGCNPAALCKLKKPTPRARAIMNMGEVWPLVLGACYDLREQVLAQLAYDTGARKSELLGLKPHDLITTCEPWRLRFERQRPNANKWETKPLKVIGGNKSVPLTDPKTRAMLAELLAQGAPQVWVGRGGQRLITSEFLFPYRTHELMSLRERFALVAPAAFPPGDFLHAIRHTFAVEMNRAGASDEEVGKALGHKSTQSTTQTYINVFVRPVDVGPVERMMKARAAGPVKWGAPPGVVEEKRPAAVGAAAGQERSKAVHPAFKKEGQRCDTPGRSVKKSGTSQARLPGMQLQPVHVKPQRSAAAATRKPTTSGRRAAYATGAGALGTNRRAAR